MPHLAPPIRWLATVAAVPALLVSISCKAGQDPGESAPRASQSQALAAAPPPEPILWSRPPQPYEDFRAEPVRELFATAERQLGQPLLFRVVPYVDRNTETGEWDLKGETLNVYYQETEPSLERLRQHADELLAEVQRRFPSLDENDSVRIHARLPEGTTVADLQPELAEHCGANNSVRTGVDPSGYEAGSLDELYFALCDGIPALDPDLTDPREPFVEENWLTTDSGS